MKNFFLCLIAIGVLGCPATVAAQSENPEAQVDGVIFLNEDDATAIGLDDLADLDGTDDELDDSLVEVEDDVVMDGVKGFAKSATGNPTYTRKIARWKDLTSPPHVRKKCVKYFKTDLLFGGGVKTCIGWKAQYRWVYRTAYLRVSAIDQSAIKTAVGLCFKESAVVAAAAAIVSGGSASAAAFEGTMKTCLATKLPGMLGLRVYARTRRGKWS